MVMNKCRLCYKNEANINIFQRDEISPFTKIKYCFGCALDVKENDGLPSSICNGCHLELEVCYRFVLKCTATDKKIRSFIVLKNIGPKTEVHNEEIEEERKDDFHDTEKSFTPTYLQELTQQIDLKLEKGKTRTYLQVKNERKRYKRRANISKLDLVCSVCGRTCPSSSALIAHMRTHTNERPFQCSSCDKTYKDRGTLKKHIERNHSQKRERRFICENCGKGFYSKSDIQIHMRVHTGETPYTCLMCPARFTQMSAMLRHKRRHTDEKSYICTTCAKPFWTKGELQKHAWVHENVRQFACTICHVQFKHKGSIRKHMQVHLEPNRFICSDCGQAFNNNDNLKRHIERKHSEKSGQCHICLKNVSNVEVHMWRHTGQRPLKCDVCACSFYAKKALALHINFKHSKRDKFKCTADGCSEIFPSKPMLVFHVAKIHEQRPLYACGKCSRMFYRKTDLSRHMLGTHKEKLT